ncbi:hypothetical protein PM076_14035 [Halorubrum ezzemoulense]|uniref:SipW-cognate class signal peptide n=1 Tax=Halorubrum ezzemoulense TaxID=337243 RepID=A0ABT4Z314_HALEZ|nr:hypothetical protein [Halorubrum ezzemoulense]MDB2245993.1 hypothetical protein [Halorubrum ezzemoulense]MDB2252780.1 hypothetical protein [Halorubrum ezzemoulense]MDB2279602.1 hypothetical protein [Halorubrum ezzemoulense]MDB2286087.1 hypothetical protein [Halorubrum ezzemoulense]MDB2289976.1 hypothetical protein [Halorubrum ezzemoulense]
MTPGGDAGRRPSGLSRRRLLAGIGGVGAVGMASGVGTGAYLADRETFANNVFGAGEVGLTVDGNPTDGTVTVGPFAVDRTTFGGRPEPERFEIGASANPVRVWLATECPDGDRLGNALEVEVVVDGESLTGGYRPLAGVERLLATGARIDDGCLAAGPDGGSIAVEVAPYLPTDSPDVGGETTDLTFRLYAEQCRHVSEEQANAPGGNPFRDEGCGESEDDCPECVELGTADFGASTAVGDVLRVEGARSYEIEITEVETKDDGEVVGVAFRLRDADGSPGPDMCSVAVKGGPDRSPEPVDIDPASPETGKIVSAPLKPDNSKQYGVSNVTVSVCAGDGDGEEEHGDDRTADDDSSGAGNGGRNGRKENGTPGKSDGKSANAGGDGRSDGDGNDGTEAN